MASPWAAYSAVLQRVFNGEELPDILANLPSWSPDRVATLFIINDDATIKKAVKTAIAATTTGGASSSGQAGAGTAAAAPRTGGGGGGGGSGAVTTGPSGVGAAAALAGPSGVGAAAAPAGEQSAQQRFVKLLAEGPQKIKRPDAALLNIIVRHFSARLREVESHTQALELYDDARSLPGSYTKSHLFKQHGLRVNGPLCAGTAKPSLVTGYHMGQPCILKFLSLRADPATGTEAGGAEAQANRILCGSMPSDTPLVAAKILVVELGPRHAEVQHPPGSYAVLVMEKYADVLDGALPLPYDALLRGMGRMVDALHWIHSRNYVHMDVKDANIFLDTQGRWFLGDFGSAVQLGSPIISTTEVFAPAPFAQLLGQPARPEYDWYMLLSTLVCHIQRELLDELRSDGKSYMPAARLKASAEQVAATAPELCGLVSDLLKRAGHLF